jgi:hypothetical protein
VYSSEIEFKIIATTRNDKMITDVIKKIFLFIFISKTSFYNYFLSSTILIVPLEKAA